MFEQVEMAPRDAIFGLSVAFLEDPRPDKVNLGVGIYRNADLKPVLFSAVKRAEEELAREGKARPYLPIDGDLDFVQKTKKLVFGPEAGDRIFGAQTIGATAALRVCADALFRLFEKKAAYFPSPTWANHKAIFRSAGLAVEHFPYYNKQTHSLGFDEMMDALSNVAEGSVVLFHTCCHNPTGVDPDREQWEKILDLVEKQHLFPIFDCAYQGFGEGIDEDVFPIRRLVEKGMEGFVCYSYSKNFGLYGERVGAFFAICESADIADRMGSQIRLIARSSYSNPPTHGAWIIRKVLGSEELYADWHGELEAMRARIHEMRRALMAGLLAKGGSRDFNFLAHQKGLFSFCGLERDQAERLTAEFGIYLPTSGRINVTGLNSQNLDLVVEAIVSVL